MGQASPASGITTTMKSIEVLALVALFSLCYSPAYASLAYFKNYIENDVKGMVVDDSGMFQSAVPQLRTTIEPLLRRQSCSAGNFLCGSTCISTSYTCCIDTRTNTPSGWCTMPNPSCCLNTGTNDAFCCSSGWKCTFDPDGCSSVAADTVTVITVTPPTPGPVTITADAPAAETTTVAGPPADTITVTPPQVVLTITQSPQTITVTQTLGGTTVTLTSGTTTVASST